MMSSVNSDNKRTPDNTTEDHNGARDDERRSSQKSLLAMKAYFNGKFRSLKRELSQDTEEH